MAGSVGFVEAVRKKYKYVREEADQDVLVGGEKAHPRRAHGHARIGGAASSAIGHPQVGKLQALDLLTRVFIPRAGVTHAGADGEIGSVCAAIEELDLEGNPLGGWGDVLSIAAELHDLGPGMATWRCGWVANTRRNQGLLCQKMYILHT